MQWVFLLLVALLQIDLGPGENVTITCPTELSGTLSNVACALESPTPTNIPIPTATLTPTNTPLPSATSVATAAPITSTVNFNDLTNLGTGKNLTGQYPTGVINWGSGWWVGGAYQQFNTNNISFSTSSITSASFTFIGSRTLVSIRADNLATTTSTVTLTCSGNPTVVRSVTVPTVLTINTGWTNPCTTVTVTSSNGWDTNYDDLVINTFNAPTVVPTVTPTIGVGYVVPDNYPTIDAAVSAVPSNSVIRIRAGTYSPSSGINKTVTLQAYGDGTVWIDGNCVDDHAIPIDASGVKVLGLGLRNTRDAGIKIGTGISGVVIDGNTINNFDCDNSGPEYQAGVAAWNSGSNIRITNNTISRRISGSLVGGLSDCIWFKSNSGSPSGGGHYIAGNILSGCWDGIGGETEDDPRGSFDRNTTIENNTIKDCEDDGIQSDGGNLNNIIRNNVIMRCALGISNAPNLTGPLEISGNTITEGRLGSYGNLACFKVGDNGTATTYYTNNTCSITAAVGAGWSQTNPGNNPIVARGNHIHVTNYVIEFSSGLPSGTSFDTDCLYTTDASRFVKWGGTLYGSLAAFRSIGQELNGSSVSSC